MLRRGPTDIGIIGTLSLCSILFQWGPDILSAFVSRFDVILVIISLIGGEATGFRLLGTMATWILYGYLVYLITPHLYQDIFWDITSTNIYRVLAIISSLSVTVSISYLVGLIMASIPPYLRTGGGFIWPLIFLPFLIHPASVFLIMTYVKKRSEAEETVIEHLLLDLDSPFLDVEFDWGEPPDVIDKMADSVTSDRVRGNRTSMDQEETWDTAFFHLYFPLQVVGILIFILNLFAPVPQLVFLISTGLIVVEERLFERSRSLIRRFSVQSIEHAVDIEYQILANLKPLSRDSKSRSAVLLIVGGIALSVLLSGMGGGILGRTPITAIGSGNTLKTWSVGLALLLSGVFGLWYWIRVLLRLPQYRIWWNKNRNVDWKEEGGLPLDSESLSTVRPIGFLIPSALLAVIAGLGRFNPPYFSGSVYLLCWLGGLTVLVYSVWRTHEAEPQPINSETYAISFGWVVLFISTAFTTTAVIYPETPFYLFLPFVVISPRLFYGFDVYIFGRQNSGVAHFAYIIMQIGLVWYWCALFLLESHLGSGIWHLGYLFAILAFLELNGAIVVFEQIQSEESMGV